MHDRDEGKAGAPGPDEDAMSDEETMVDEDPMADEETTQVYGPEAPYAHRQPPPELEERVVADFRSAMGGRRDSGPGIRPWAPRLRRRTSWVRVAAVVVVFVGGWGTGVLTSRVRGPVPEASSSQLASPDRPSYVMLLREGERFEPGDDPAAVVDAYAAWVRSVVSTGIAVSGEELGADRAIVGGEARSATGEGRIGGFFLLDVATLDEARRLAEGHPHVAAGGVIEIAPVVRR